MYTFLIEVNSIILVGFTSIREVVYKVIFKCGTSSIAHYFNEVACSSAGVDNL